MLTKEQILNCNDVKLEKVAVPEWGGEIYVKSISGKERDAVDSFIASAGRGSSYPGFRALLCTYAICDETGQSLFTPSDVQALEAKNAVVLQRVFDKALAVNGMSAEAAQQKKDIFQE